MFRTHPMPMNDLEYLGVKKMIGQQRTNRLKRKDQQQRETKYQLLKTKSEREGENGTQR
jgi:hypothetical protein